MSHPGGAIARILTRSGTTAGVGALIGAREIVTCAHVVNAALGRDLGSRAVPAEPIEVSFPLAGHRWPVKVRVAQWFPLAPDGEVGDDLAVLLLLGDTPQGAAPARLAAGSYRFGHSADVFGYPGVPPRPDGSWVPVAVRGTVGGGLLQLDAHSSAALRVQPGFSGGPVIDSETGEVIGLLRMAPPAESGDRDSYAIPAERIATLRGAGADPQDGRSGTTPYVFHLLTGHTGTVSGTAFSPNGEILATGGADGTVRLWDTRTRETTATLPHPAAVTSVAFSPDGAALASGGADGVIRLWDPQARKVTAALTHDAAVTAMAFHRSGKALLAGGADGAVRLWDISARTPMADFAHDGTVTLVEFSRPDGMIAARAADGTVKVWQGPTGDNPHIVIPPVPLGPTGLVTALSRGAMNLAVGLPDGTIQVSDVASPQSGSTWWLEFSPRACLILYSEPDGSYYVRDIGPPNGTTVLSGHVAPVASLAFSRGSTMLACGGGDGSVRLWTFEDTRHVAGRGTAVPAVLTGHTGAVHALAFSPDGATLASGGADGTIRVWDVATRANIDFLADHTDMVNSIAYIWDGTAIISGGADRRARMWLLSQRGTSTAFELPDDMWALAFARMNADVWESGITQIPGLGRGLRSVAFAPDGRTYAFVLDDNRVVLKDHAEGPWSTVSDNGPEITSVTFSRDGGMLATCSGDGTIQLYPVAASQPADGFRIWDAAPGATVAFFPKSMNSVAFSPDGTLLATGSRDGTVRLWDVESATLVAAFTGHNGPVNAMIFSPQGETVATGGEDATLRLWTLNPTGSARSLEIWVS